MAGCLLFYSRFLSATSLDLTMLPSKIGGLHDNAWLIDNVLRVGRRVISEQCSIGIRRLSRCYKKKNLTRSGWLAALLTRFRRPVNKQPLVVEARDSSPVHRPWQAWHAWLQVEWRYCHHRRLVKCAFLRDCHSSSWLPSWCPSQRSILLLELSHYAYFPYKCILRFNPTIRVRYRRSGSFKNSSHSSCWYLQSL